MDVAHLLFFGHDRSGITLSWCLGKRSHTGSVRRTCERGGSRLWIARMLGAHVVTRETIVCALCSFCQAATQHFRVRFLITDAYLYVMLVGLPLQAARTGLHADGTTF